MKEELNESKKIVLTASYRGGNRKKKTIKTKRNKKKLLNKTKRNKNKSKQ